MDFLKKNYEKVLLGVVLLGLLGAIAMLLIQVNGEKAWLVEQQGINKPNPKSLPPLDFARSETALKVLQDKVSLELAPPHNVINPVPWVRTTDGKVFKQETGRGYGPAAVKVVNIRPLYLILTYDTNSVGGYVIAVERQAAAKPGDRSRQTRIVAENVKSDLFTLRGIKGPTNNPTELVLELAGSGKRITLAPPKDYREAEGYIAALRYDPDNKNVDPKEYRKNELMMIEGEQYKVVAIEETDVVLSAIPNGKKTTVHLDSSKPAR